MALAFLAEMADVRSPPWLDTGSTSTESFAPPASARSSSILLPKGDPLPGEYYSTTSSSSAA